jgi:hypothetical protein
LKYSNIRFSEVTLTKPRKKRCGGVHDTAH